MQFEIESKVLRKCLSVASSALPPRAAEPRFGALWITATPESLVVEGFNQDWTIHEAVANCKVESQGEIAVLAATINEVVNSLPDGPVSVSLAGTKLTLKTAIGKVSIPVLNEARPNIVRKSGKVFFECPKTILSELIRAGSFAERIEKGVSVGKTSFTVQNGTVVFVCRSSSSACSVEVAPSQENEKVFVELSRLRKAAAACDGEAVSVLAGDGFLRLESDSESVGVSVEFRQAPSHAVIVPTGDSESASAEIDATNVASFLSALSQCASVKLPESCTVTLEFDPDAGGVRFSIETSGGESECFVPAVCSCKKTVWARIEDMEQATKCVSRGGPFRVAVLSKGGEDKAVLLENGSKTIRMFSAAMFRE
jgi:DNA polymerase III sliding clamp (beta) subunit (PCNA family)